MKRRNKKALSPLRRAALVTTLLLIGGAVVALLLYRQTSYLSLLLLGILQLFPAIMNLLLFLPITQKREKKENVEQVAAALPEPVTDEAQAAEPAADAEQETVDKKAKRRARMRGAFRKLGHACRDLVGHARDVYAEHRNPIIAALLLVGILGFNIYFWISARIAPLVGMLYYYVPVLLAAFFVLYIVLDKWCKHTSAQIKDAHSTDNPAEPDPLLFDKAILNSLRGALSVARLGIVLEIAIIMLRMLEVVDWGNALIVIMCLLFLYETVFLVISLAVRFIRRELSTSPELTIPMPGLGGEDLGILSYLEKNTGITMRSLWSIHLAGRIVPYAALSIVLLLWGFSGMVKIEAHQQGAHYRFGELQEEILQPGLHMTLPWPFDSVEVYDTEVIKQATIGYISDQNADNIWTEAHGTEEFKLLLGGGKELVSINMRVEFAIDDLRTYLTGSAAPEALMEAAAYELITARTIGTDLASLLSVDRVAFMEEFKADLIQHTADYDTGLRVVNVVLESIHPPVEIADIYQEVINATIQAEQDIAYANGEAAVLKIQAETNKDASIKEAEALQVMEVAKAKATVAKFEGSKEAHAANKDSYEYYKYLNAVRKAFSNGNLILIGDGVDSNKIYIGSIGQN